MTNVNKLRDSNFGSRRQSIIQKYDTTGDGVFQSEAIDNIVDDYMATILNNNTLLDANYNQKKLLGFASILIIILSFANLGTAILAANISKDTVVIDGRFVTNDGTAEAISTRNSVKTITKKEDPRANKWDPISDGEDTNIEGDNSEHASMPFICFTNEEVDAIFESTIEGSGTNIIIQSDEDDGSMSRKVVPIHGAGREGRKGFSFPNSHVEFVPDDKGLCSERRRRMHWGDTFHNSFVHNVNEWIMIPVRGFGEYALM